MPGYIHKPGRVGVISRSGTLDLRGGASANPTRHRAIDLRRDRRRPIIGTNQIDALELFNKDSGTDAVIFIGEIGGTAEEDAAEYIKQNFKKPVVAFIAGQTAPKDGGMGHAGAIISGGQRRCGRQDWRRSSGRHQRRDEPGRSRLTMKAALDGRKN